MAIQLSTHMNLSQLESLISCRLGRDIQTMVIDYHIEHRKSEAAIRLVGALALNIRTGWITTFRINSPETNTKITALIEVCDKYQIPHNTVDVEAIQKDGRWFRDCWEGPYGHSVTRADFDLLGYDPLIMGRYWSVFGAVK